MSSGSAPPPRQTSRTGRFDLFKGDLGFGPKADRVGHPGFLPPFSVPRPLLRQIQPVGDRQAAVVISQRQRNRDLTVVLLAELTAILSGHPNRMPPLFGKPKERDGLLAEAEVIIGGW